MTGRLLADCRTFTTMRKKGCMPLTGARDMTQPHPDNSRPVATLPSRSTIAPRGCSDTVRADPDRPLVQLRYASGREPVPADAKGRFRCAKLRGRLYIQCCETGDLLYTPPDFIRLPDRSSLVELANQASRCGVLSIKHIINFESHAPRAFGYSKRGPVTR